MTECAFNLEVTVGRWERPEPFEYVFLGPDGAPLDLSDYDVSVVQWVTSDPDAGVPYSTPTADWIDGSKGRAAFRWPDHLLDGPAGIYMLTFWASKSGSQRISGDPIEVTTEERGPAPPGS